MGKFCLGVITRLGGSDLYCIESRGLLDLYIQPFVCFSVRNSVYSNSLGWVLCYDEDVDRVCVEFDVTIYLK